MATPLKDHFTTEVPERIAAALIDVYPSFDGPAFVERATQGWDALELTARARQVAAAMADFLPPDRGRALELVVASLGPELPNADPDDAPRTDPEHGGDHNPIAGFFYMPHGYFVHDHGVGHFEQAMRANYELTKRFTAEFAIRSLLETEPERTLAVLAEWADDDNVHVRRLVSEGTRSRLPWASRLRNFQADPEPVLALLERLKDDPVEYVRRSVANNLNDIAKDHPERVVEVARAWWNDGDRDRRRLVRHGLRTLIKQGHPGALDVLGYGESSPVAVVHATVEPERLAIGGSVTISLELENPSSSECGALVDLRVHFVKADGSTSAKVFKGAEIAIGPGERTTVRKSVSVRQHSTRTHYPGTHDVEAMINGAAHHVGAFELEAQATAGRGR